MQLPRALPLHCLVGDGQGKQSGRFLSTFLWLISGKSAGNLSLDAVIWLIAPEGMGVNPNRSAQGQ